MIHGILKCCFAVHFRLLMFTGTVLILSMFLPLLVVKGRILAGCVTSHLLLLWLFLGHLQKCIANKSRPALERHCVCSRAGLRGQLIQSCSDTTAIPLRPYHCGHTASAIPLRPYHRGHATAAIPLRPYHCGHTTVTYKYIVPVRFRIIAAPRPPFIIPQHVAHNSPPLTPREGLPNGCPPERGGGGGGGTPYTNIVVQIDKSPNIL